MNGIDASKIIDQLNQIATPAIRELLATYTRQAVSQGHVDITVGMIEVIAAGAIALLSLVLVGVAAANSEHDDGWGFAVSLSILLFIGALILGGAGINNIVNGNQELANPSYYALQNLLGQIHP